MITKSKESDSKFVTILAETIIKPMINGFLVDENKNITNQKGDISVSDSGEDKTDLFKCPHCEKTSYSSPGLKGHITKMHQEKSGENGILKEKAKDEDLYDQKDIIVKNKNRGDNKKSDHDEIKEEADKVMNLLLKKVIEISDDNEPDENIEEVTIEEICDNKDEPMEKKYILKC